MKKMKKCILSLWLCCMAFVQGQAQQITGKVMDENNSPMEFVNVVLLTAEDSTFVKGAVTKADGSFVIDTECKGGILRAVRGVSNGIQDLQRCERWYYPDAVGGKDDGRGSGERTTATVQNDGRGHDDYRCQHHAQQTRYSR